ncbi:MAG: hypothetical protein N2Z72_03850 [Bacteroidales bacterium]|nr:hypothetical protein [Bacteroidales bacterium]
MRRKIKFWLFFLLLIAILFACWNNISNPKKRGTPAYVAYQFLTNMQQLNFEGAAAYGTENTKTALRLMRTLVYMLPEDKRTNIVAGQVKIVRCEISKTNRSRATCFYTVNQGEVKSLDMVYDGGKWLVDFKKETPTSPEQWLKIKVDSTRRK